MASKMFDNIIKKLRGGNTYTSNTVISLELDFELPRGYIAKLRHVKQRVDSIEKDLAAIDSDAEWAYQMALLRDPDDITTTFTPTNNVEHDVVVEHRVGVHINPVATVGSVTLIGKIQDDRQLDREGADIFTARNMRWNVVAAGGQQANATEATGNVYIDYTLEVIRDDDIINLLDIL